MKKLPFLLLFLMLGCSSSERASQPAEPVAVHDTVIVHEDPCMKCVSECKDAADPKACRKACREKCCRERAEEDR